MARASSGMDLNGQIAALLRDFAAIQKSKQSMWGYKRAASAVLALEEPIASFLQADGTLRKIPNIGPSSTRVIVEVLQTGTSATVERAIADSGQTSRHQPSPESSRSVPQPRAGRGGAEEPEACGPAPRGLSRRSSNALHVERWQPDARRHRRGGPGPRVLVLRRDRSLVRVEDCRRRLDDGSAQAASRD